jgi:hypothetical protein
MFVAPLLELSLLGESARCIFESQIGPLLALFALLTHSVALIFSELLNLLSPAVYDCRHWCAS